MKNSITMLIIFSFIGIAVFGFLGMGSHTIGHVPNGCIAALQRETGCPAPQNPIDFAIFHINAFKIFSSIDVSATMLLSIIFILSAAVLYTIFKSLEPQLFALTTNKAELNKYPGSYGFYTPNELKFRRWLTLHEVRDAAF